MAKKKSKPAAPAPVAPADAPGGPLGVLETPRGRWAWLLLFVLLFPLYLTCASREFGGGTGGDNVVYFLLGKALATGQGYVDLYLPGNPPHAKYPPGLPLLLAPFHLLFDQPLLPMHVMLILFNTLAVVLAGMVTARMAGSRRVGLAVGLLFGLGSRMYLQNLHILSEPPYMFFCCLTLLLLPAGEDETLSPGRVAGIGLAAAAAFFTRTMGISVVTAAVAGLWFNRTTVTVKGRRLPAALPAVAVWAGFFLLWVIRNRLTGAGSEYLTELLYVDPYNPDLGLIGIGGYLARLGKNLTYYYQVIGATLFRDFAGAAARQTLLVPLTWLLPALMAAGAALDVWRGGRSTSVFCAASMFIAVSWSYQDPRFLLPIFSFLLYYLLVALDGLGRLVKLRRSWIVPAAAAGVILVFQASLLPALVGLRFKDFRQPRQPLTVEGLSRPWTETILNYAKYETNAEVYANPNATTQRVLFLVVNRVAAELTPPDSIILSRKPMYTYLLSGRKSVPLYFSSDPDQQWAFLQRKRVDYIVLGAGEQALTPTLQKWPERFRTVAAITGRAYLIKVYRDR